MKVIDKMLIIQTLIKKRFGCVRHTYLASNGIKYIFSTNVEKIDISDIIEFSKSFNIEININERDVVITSSEFVRNSSNKTKSLAHKIGKAYFEFYGAIYTSYNSNNVFCLRVKFENASDIDKVNKTILQFGFKYNMDYKNKEYLSIRLIPIE